MRRASGSSCRPCRTGRRRGRRRATSPAAGARARAGRRRPRSASRPSAPPPRPAPPRCPDREVVRAERADVEPAGENRHDVRAYFLLRDRAVVPSLHVRDAHGRDAPDPLGDPTARDPVVGAWAERRHEREPAEALDGRTPWGPHRGVRSVDLDRVHGARRNHEATGPEIRVAVGFSQANREHEDVARQRRPGCCPDQRLCVDPRPRGVLSLENHQACRRRGSLRLEQGVGPQSQRVCSRSRRGNTQRCRLHAATSQ